MLNHMPPTVLEAESSAAAVAPVSSGEVRRVKSVDALRGFDMFWIIGADALFHALKKIGGGNPIMDAAATQLEHAQWHGFRFYDLIFPLFVFIVGVSIVFALPRRIEQHGRSAALRQVFRRFAILYFLGLITYGGIAGGLEQVRLMGVLQRIAICYFAASLAFLYLGVRGLLLVFFTLLFGYWAVMTFVPVPGAGAGSFAEGKNLANYIDARYLPLRKWDGTHDPEGLLSTLPAIATCLLGVLAGLLLRGPHRDEEKVMILASFGFGAVLFGNVWALQFPLIKKIWTSSFVLVAGGYSAMLLALFYYIIDVRKIDRWSRPFVWIGTNAITIYLVVHLVDLQALAQRFLGGEIAAGLNGLRNGLADLLTALLALGFALLFCRFLYQRKIFLKV